MTVKNSNLGPPEPIYPPDLSRALLYYAISISTFFLAALLGGFIPTLITGTLLLTFASAYLGEQRYKARVYRELLLSRYEKIAPLDLEAITSWGVHINSEPTEIP